MNLKQMAAEKAAEYVKDGMVVGLGTGSTAYYAVKKLGSMIGKDFNIVGIPTSKETEITALESGIILSNLEEYPEVDLTIDGADEFDPNLNLIKGMGGALLREKIVASASKMEIIVVDSSKKVDVLGTKSPLPVEIISFGWKKTLEKLKGLGCEAELRVKDGSTFITDNNNYMIDCSFKSIPNSKELEPEINCITGVVENGLFLGLTDLVIMAAEDGVQLFS